MWLTSVLDKLKNDSHIPIAILVFAVTTTIHLWTKRDLGPQYVNSIYAMYVFLGGHAGAQMWKDVKVNGDSNDSSGSTGSGGTPPDTGGTT
jgi:hypothetical protein